MDGRYFSEYQLTAPNVAHQRLLCEKLRNTRRFGLIEDDQVNPMTVRLLLMREANSQLVSFCNAQRDSVRDLKKYIEKPEWTYGPSTVQVLQVYTSSGSCMNTPVVSLPRHSTGAYPKTFDFNGGDAFYSYELDPGPNRYVSSKAFPMIELHRHLFNFFSNFGSALDRLGYETGKILGNSFKYWHDLTDAHHGDAIKVARHSGALAAVYQVQGRSIYSGGIKKYRNRIVHDGILDVRVDTDSGEIFLPDDPDAVTLTYTRLLTDVCSLLYTDALIFLDLVYKELIPIA